MTEKQSKTFTEFLQAKNVTTKGKRSNSGDSLLCPKKLFSDTTLVIVEAAV